MSNQVYLIKKITYVSILIAMMVVLSQTMRIQIIPRTSIPIFLIPIFISGFILNWYWCLLIGFMGHFLSDLTLWGFTLGSLCWNIGTGLLAILIKLINLIKINHIIKIILILLTNIIIYTPIDFILFWLNFGVLNIEQIIIGILITNTICLPLFYLISIKISKKLNIKLIKGDK
ncbi:ECF transporter S component [Spiroplasma endosymbiont of Glossina fuscipes fuscipes]|uniref:ECF transporter S component n=1 Tax=Spiroplasma endosymbiont of Glossina fuscipes fuscipes TaxID=2004463 RepID=UPI003C76D163